MLNEKGKNFFVCLSNLSQSLPCLSFQIFSSWYRRVKVERESSDNPLITFEVLKISLEEREREMRCEWVRIDAVLHLPAKTYHKHVPAEAFHSPCHVTGCLSRLQIVPIRYWLQLENSLCLFHFQIQRNNEHRSIICFLKNMVYKGNNFLQHQDPDIQPRWSRYLYWVHLSSDG